MKRFFKSLLMLTALIAACILIDPTEAKAAGVDDLTFTLNDDGASYSVSDCDTSATGALEIPATYNGLPVTTIGYRAFYGCSKLTSITIPDSVTSVGGSAFYGCSKLASVTIPDSVTSIGSHTFYDCAQLAEITIPDGVTSIKSYTFYDCSQLTSITIPDGVTSIGSHAFYGCSRLAEITIPDGVASIDSYTFYGCSQLAGITIPDSVTIIGDYAFYRCTSLASITIPDNVTAICSHAFYECDSLTSITIGNSVRSIGNLAFHMCRKLTSITIPGSVRYIDNYAFSTCYDLTSVTIGNGVTSIGKYVFYQCYDLTSITITDSVTSIGDYAFWYCDSLTDVYYTGTQAEWDSIAIGQVNDSLLNAALHFGHDSTDGYTEEIIPGYAATCTETGLTDGKKCTACGVILTAQEEIPALGHAEETVPAKAATCTETGLTDGVKCSVCGEILTAQEEIPATGHSFGEDAVCDTCGYTKLIADAITLDAANKLTVTDEETTHGNYRATVYFLGSETVEDISDEVALKAIDADAKTHWGLKSINNVQLLENGNYVVYVHYNEGTGAKQTAMKAFTVDITKPAIEMNGHKVAVTAGDDNCINYRATVYYLGENAVENITDEAALKANAESAKTYWGLDDINKVQLLNNGNYVILLHYNIGTSAKQTVAKAVTRDLDEVTLDIVSGKLVAADPGSNYIHHRAVVYYLGEETSIDNAVSSKTYWTLNTINKVTLTEPGNYVILLHYNLADSAKLTTTLQVTI